MCLTWLSTSPFGEKENRKRNLILLFSHLYPPPPISSPSKGGGGLRWGVSPKEEED